MMYINMKIVATTILNKIEGESNVGEHSYLVFHDENALIDYDYLYGKKHFVEIYLQELLKNSYKSLYKVTLNVKFWQTESNIFKVDLISP